MHVIFPVFNFKGRDTEWGKRLHPTFLQPWRSIFIPRPFGEVLQNAGQSALASCLVRTWQEVARQERRGQEEGSPPREEEKSVDIVFWGFPGFPPPPRPDSAWLSFQTMLRLSVPPQIHFSLEAFATQIVAKGLEARVLPTMGDEVGTLAEGFAAHLALVGLLTCGLQKDGHKFTTT